MKLSWKSLAITPFKAFLKIEKSKRCLELVSLPNFPHDFQRKIFHTLYSINSSKFIVWFPFVRKILGNLCIVIVCYPGCDVIDFATNLKNLVKPLVLDDQKVKIKVSWERRNLLRWNKMHFSSLLKDLNWWKPTYFFCRWVSNFNLLLMEHIQPHGSQFHNNLVSSNVYITAQL